MDIFSCTTYATFAKGIKNSCHTVSGFFLGGALDVNDAVCNGKVDARDSAESLAPFLDRVPNSVRHVWVAIARFEHVPDFQTLGYNNKK